MIVTFYSYKGGVGRSMALVNVGELLADWGYRVLLCDWDLEAPGLERYLLYNESTFFNDPAGRAAYENELTSALAHPGLMDLLIEYKTVLTQPPVVPPEEEKNKFASVGKLFLRRPSSFAHDVSQRRRTGSLTLLSAGRREGPWFQKYAQSVRDFDWTEFYEKWGGNAYIEFFRQDICGAAGAGRDPAAADIVLVDSRTGVTEQGGVCTHHLADIVVLISAPNEANIEGTQWMASSLLKASSLGIRGERPPLQIIPVESRVEITTEKDLVYDFHEYFQKKLADVLPPAIGNQEEFFSAARIPYIGYYSFRERIVAREERKSKELYRAYQALADGIVRCGAAAELIEDHVPDEIASRRGPTRGARALRPQGAVYLCYGRADRGRAEFLAGGLRSVGVEVWADFLHVPGATLEKSAASLLLSGEAGLTAALRSELDAALRLLARRVHPIVVVTTTPSSFSSPSGLRVPEIALPPDPDRAFFERLAAELATAQPTEVTKESPYRVGSASEAEGRSFFGRDRELAEAIALFADAPNGWLNIVGDSGSGKSAFVRAAMVPAIRRGLVAGLPGETPVAVFNPGADSMLELASALFTSELAPGMALRQIRERLGGGSGALRDFIRELTAGGEPVVLVCDGLEAELRRPGLSLLLDALRDCLTAEPKLSFRLITTVRTDADALRSTRLNASAAVYQLEPMKEAQLREAIEGPAKVVGVRFESGLVDRVMDECRTATQPLRLARRVLDRVWTQTGGIVLTHVAYDAVGGVAGVLAATAESTFGSLTDDEKRVARTILASLAWRVYHGSPASYDTTAATAASDTNMQVGEVISKLSDAGLIAISRDVVQLAHPSLLQWSRLMEWVEADDKSLRRREDLATAARAWMAAGKPSSGLPTGAQLRYFQKGVSAATAEEIAFLAAARGYEKRVQRIAMLLTILIVLVVVWVFLLGNSNGERPQPMGQAAVIAPREATITPHQTTATTETTDTPFTAMSSTVPETIPPGRGVQTPRPRTQFESFGYYDESYTSEHHEWVRQPGKRWKETQSWIGNTTDEDAPPRVFTWTEVGRTVVDGTEGAVLALGTSRLLFVPDINARGKWKTTVLERATPGAEWSEFIDLKHYDLRE